jgi:hypothetical protein
MKTWLPALQRGCYAASLALLCLTIGLAPLPFGSVGLPAISVWTAILGIVAVLATAGSRQVSQPWLLLVLWGFCGCWLTVLYFQTAHPAPFLSKLASPLWKQSSELLGDEFRPVISVVRGQPLSSQGPALLATLALSCGFVVGAGRRNARWILGSFAGSGILYAIYGIVSFLIDPTSLLGIEKEAYQTVLTATFVNRNTAAVYFGSCAVIWLLVLCENVHHSAAQPLSWRRLTAKFQGGVSAATAVTLGALFLCLTTMFMTGSRAGSLTSMVGLTIAFLAYFARTLPSRSSFLLASVSVVAAAGILVQTLGGSVTERVDVQGLSDEGRWQTYRSTVRLISDVPYLGTGLGTFAWIFPAYRSGEISIWGVWDRAHNTLLELAVEVGVPMTVLLCIGWVLMFGLLFRGIVIRRRNIAIPAAAMAIFAIATLHSMVDFSLQIPGYAVIFFAVVGAGLAHSFQPAAKPH